MIASGDGIYGRGPVSEQAPGNVGISSRVPFSSYLLPVGTRVFSSVPPPRPIAKEPPLSAVLHCNKVSTTSLQSGTRPAPIPPVGTAPPAQTTCLPESASVAPQSGKWKGLAIVAAIIIGFWLFAGALTRKAML